MIPKRESPFIAIVRSAEAVARRLNIPLAEALQFVIELRASRNSNKIDYRELQAGAAN